MNAEQIFEVRFSKKSKFAYLCFKYICSRQAGHRLCGYIDRIMVYVNEFSQKDDDDELREFCNQACEAFVLRCPEAITPHIKSV